MPAIKRRDKVCVKCGSTERLEVNHKGDSLDHRLVALELLCHACHLPDTLARANAARPREKRKPERHPGLR